MTSIQPNASRAVQYTAPQQQGTQPQADAGRARAASQPTTQDGQLLPADRQQHVDNQEGRARTVLQRSVNQGRISPEDARAYFSQLEERGEAWVAEGQTEDLSPAAQHAANQVERGRDVLQRSVNQGRIDSPGAREYFSRLEDRAANWAENQS